VPPRELAKLLRSPPVLVSPPLQPEALGVPPDRSGKPPKAKKAIG
jgi:hypothetical protein